MFVDQLCQRTNSLAIASVVSMLLASGCTPAPQSAPATTVAVATRPSIAQVRLGDTLEVIQTLAPAPAPKCGADPEAEPNDPNNPIVCEVTGAFAGRTIPFSASVTNGRVRSVHNTDLAADDSKAVSAAMHTALGEPSSIEQSGAIRRETWTVGSETVRIELDSAYGGGSVVLAGEPPTDAAATPVAASTSTCTDALMAVKGLCIGMPIEQAVERVATFSNDALSERRLPGQPLVIHDNAVGSIQLLSRDGRLVTFFIGGPAAESAFRAGDMPIEDFAQAIIDNYDVPELKVESVTEEPMGRATLRTVTYVHRFDEGIEVKVRGNSVGAKSLEVSAVTPAAARTFD